jgi:L-ascorbate metabolism protein UlaG (beta-lactamase superfamily)
MRVSVSTVTFVAMLLLSLLSCASSSLHVSQTPMSTRDGSTIQSSKGKAFSITYIANEGVLISSGRKQVLIDGLHREYKPAYAFPPPDLLSSLELARPPYDEIDLVLVSHLHLDHFHPESVGLHLKNNRGAQLVSSAQIVDLVRKQYSDFPKIENRVREVAPTWKTKSAFSVGGINLQVLGLRHGSAHFSWIQNLGHLIEIDGRKFLHLGDADMTDENFASFRLHEEGIDVAFIPYWFLLSENGRALVRKQFNPKTVIAVHVPPAEAEKLAAEIPKNYPGAIVLKKILETRSF